MGSSCSSQAAVMEEATAPPPARTPGATTPFLDSFMEIYGGDTETEASRWSNRRRRRRRQQLRDEARLAEIVALQQSLAAMEDFFQSLLGQANLYIEAMDPQTGGNSGPPPASEAAVRELPIVTVPKNQLCGICGEPFEDGKATALPCGHLFHTHNCIEPWLNRHCTCPVCRYELPTDDAAFEEGRAERMASRKLPECCEQGERCCADSDSDHYEEEEEDGCALWRELQEGRFHGVGDDGFLEDDEYMQDDLLGKHSDSWASSFISVSESIEKEVSDTETSFSDHETNLANQEEIEGL